MIAETLEENVSLVSSLWSNGESEQVHHNSLVEVNRWELSLVELISYLRS
jgi:hypothetical protein